MFYGISNENWEGNCEEYELESHGVSCSYNIGSRLVDVDSPSYSSLEVDFPRDSGAVLIHFTMTRTFYGIGNEIGRDIARNMNSKVTVRHVLTLLVRELLTSIHHGGWTFCATAEEHL